MPFSLLCDSYRDLLDHGFAVLNIANLTEKVSGHLTVILYADFVIQSCVGVFFASNIVGFLMVPNSFKLEILPFGVA